MCFNWYAVGYGQQEHLTWSLRSVILLGASPVWNLLPKVKQLQLRISVFAKLKRVLAEWPVWWPDCFLPAYVFNQWLLLAEESSIC